MKTAVCMARFRLSGDHAQSWRSRPDKPRRHRDDQRPAPKLGAVNRAQAVVRLVNQRLRPQTEKPPSMAAFRQNYQALKAKT
ncbi:hypothetical protein [Mesorhizobium sp. B263B2A]|uniref:hypothetical protein n=1 Tax=Mesorhizobium sp. B263B2A TaxID=2876669 RepID=UPI001CD140B7|nr:hypothetical protein [Mesorhizobium sp. B263B2A]MCA0034688.1 hypothetical protein [Mesorhizobium sp. B263B2A]